MPSQERSQSFLYECSGQSAQERQRRLSEQKQRRREHHQQQMLCHMRGQKECVESVERRLQSQKQCKQSAKKSPEPVEVPAAMQELTSACPPAQIHQDHH